MCTVSVPEKYNDLHINAVEKEKCLENKTVIRIGAATCGISAGALEVKTAFEMSWRHTISMPWWKKSDAWDTAMPNLWL